MKFLIEKKDGSIEIMQLVSGTIEDALSKWSQLGTNAQDYLSHCEIDEASIPSNRYFRKAWTKNGNSVTQDMTKCRAIQREKLGNLSSIDAATTPEEIQAIKR